MDHLPLPRGSQLSRHDIVPYLCSVPYDCQSFEDYPLRDPSLLTVFEPENLFNARFNHSKYLERPVDVLEDFYQRWLFFGLLHACLDDSFCQDDFVTTFDSTTIADCKDNAGSYPLPSRVTTVLLRGYLNEWAQKQEETTPSQVLQQCERIRRCLSITYQALRVLDSSKNFNPALKLSIALLGEAIDEVIIYLLDRVKEHVKAPTSVSKYDGQVIVSDYFQERLIQNGWCPSIAPNYTDYKGWNSVSRMWYYCQFHDFEGNGAHGACTKDECKLISGHQLKYNRLHSEETCTCNDVVLDMAKIYEILDMGSFPLLKVSQSPEGYASVEVVAFDTRRPYVAISHVWSQGLGNPHANSLPNCQILRLARLVEQLGPRTKDLEALHSSNALPEFNAACSFWSKRNCPSEFYEDLVHGGHWCGLSIRQALRTSKVEECLLWIDTLCCPTESLRYKKLSLDKMVETYNEAAAVLVLDSSLAQKVSKDMDFFEMTARISMSPWMTRLWTFQEADLALQLWFQFQDDVIELGDLLYQRPQEFKSDAVLKSMAFFMQLRDLLGMKPAELLSSQSNRAVNHMLSSLPFRLRSRSVSVESDEALCLATLLELDVKLITGIQDSSLRMRKIWSLLLERGPINASFIFHPSARLFMDGFRWAPATLLNVPRTLGVNIFESTETGSRDSLGLKVIYPGCSLRLPFSWNSSSLKLLRCVGGADVNDFDVRIRPGVWGLLTINAQRFGELADKRSLFRWMHNHFLSLRCIHRNGITLDISSAQKVKYMDVLIGYEIKHPTSSGRVIMSYSTAAFMLRNNTKSACCELAFQGVQALLAQPLGHELMRALKNEVQLDEAAAETLWNKFRDWSSVWALNTTRDAEDLNINGRISPANLVFIYMRIFLTGGLAEIDTIYPPTEWIVD